MKTAAEIAMAHDRLLLLHRGDVPGTEPLQGAAADAISMALAALGWTIGQEEPEFSEFLADIDRAFDEAGLQLTVQPEGN